MVRFLRRLCPHRFGWSYNTHRRRRFCRVCGQEQRRIAQRWVDVIEWNPEHLNVKVSLTTTKRDA